MGENQATILAQDKPSLAELPTPPTSFCIVSPLATARSQTTRKLARLVLGTIAPSLRWLPVKIDLAAGAELGTETGQGHKMRAVMFLFVTRL